MRNSWIRVRPTRDTRNEMRCAQKEGGRKQMRDTIFNYNKPTTHIRVKEA